MMTSKQFILEISNKICKKPLHWKIQNIVERIEEDLNKEVKIHVNKMENSILHKCQFFSH